MTRRLVFLLEEPSMANLLLELMPRVFPGWVHTEQFLCVKHQGKSDLDKSIPRKLQAWKTPGDVFVVLRDTDGVECGQLKRDLVKICRKNGRPDTLIRLVCQELESWYLGDLGALAAVFGDSKLSSPRMKKRFLSPDDWQKPSVELERLIPDFQKGSGARLMGRELSLSDASNCSKSYAVFLAGVRRLAKSTA